MLIAVLAALPLPAAQATPTCFGKRATIVGRDDRDIRGTNRDDVIVATEGEVEVRARGGNDLICLEGPSYDVAYGGPGNDRIDAGSGYRWKTLYGGPGSDFLYEKAGGADVAHFYGGRGNDEIRAGDSSGQDDEDSDWLIGGPGDDLLLQGAGDSYFEGGPGDDVMSAGPDDDVLSFHMADAGVTADLSGDVATGDGRDRIAGFDHVYGSAFDDELAGTAESNRIDGDGGNDAMAGRGGDDVLNGGFGADEMSGGDGDDEVEGGDGDDSYDGGDGRDLVAFTTATVPVTVDLAAGSATGDGDDTFIGFEDASGSLQADTLLGDDGPNYLDAMAGVMTGGDTVDGRGGDDTIYAHFGGVLDGGDGSDTILYGVGTESVIVNLSTDVDSWDNVVAEIENVTSRYVTLDATGDEGPNRFLGSTRADVVRGLGGDDFLFGRLGDDHLDGGLGADSVHGGRGDDTCTNGESVEGCEA